MAGGVDGGSGAESGLGVGVGSSTAFGGVGSGDMSASLMTVVSVIAIGALIESVIVRGFGVRDFETKWLTVIPNCALKSTTVVRSTVGVSIAACVIGVVIESGPVTVIGADVVI